MSSTATKAGKADEMDEAEAAPIFAKGMITDFITGNPVKETDKEKVADVVIWRDAVAFPTGE